MTRLLGFAIVIGVQAYSADPSPVSGKAGDWARFLVTRKNEAMSFQNFTDAPRYRVLRDVNGAYVTIDLLSESNGRRNTIGGGRFGPTGPYDPTLQIFAPGQVKETSRSEETIVAAGKSYACTKVVRTIARPFDKQKGQSGWNGTSTVWLSATVPLGLVKVVNDYAEDYGAKASKISETWILESAGSNWKP
jgi:hypothetical protein